MYTCMSAHYRGRMKYYNVIHILRDSLTRNCVEIWLGSLHCSLLILPVENSSNHLPVDVREDGNNVIGESRDLLIITGTLGRNLVTYSVWDWEPYPHIIPIPHSLHHLLDIACIEGGVCVHMFEKQGERNRGGREREGERERAGERC